MVDTQQFPGNQPQQPAGDSALQPGAVLQSRYKIAGIIGVGGMGSVYKARDLHFPNVTRYVAVKEMFNLSTDQNMRELTLKTFERESDMLASLSHPAVPEIYDYFPSEARAYLVMEFINGRDLEAIINASLEPIEVETALKWAIALCDVLGYLHEQEGEPIIFRDVKPSNIMIDQHGQLRLVDFGIAKVFHPDAKHTMIGTEGYSAPEQYRGEASPASDVYGVGATLHHLLTRRDPRLEPPFTFSERPIRDANEEVSAEFASVIMKALEFEVEDRFQNATAMKDALVALEQPAAGVSRAVASAAPLDDGDPSEWNIEDQASGVKPIWVFECEDKITSSPSMHRGLVYIGAYDNNVYALDAESGTFKWKFPSKGAVISTPTVAEKENLVLFGSLDHHLYALDARVGQLAWRTPTEGPVQSTPSLTHGHVFVGSDDGRLYAVRLSNGQVQWTATGGSAIRTRPLVSSELIIFGTQDGEVISVDLSGKPVWRFSAKRAVYSSPLEYDGLVIFGSLDWQLYAVDLKRGWKVWDYRAGKPIISSPTLGGDKIFVGSVDGRLYAIEATSGRERWQFQTENQITSSPAYVDGAVYFGGVDGKVYSLDAKNGQLRWSFETGGPIPSSPVIRDGVVYIGSMDHRVYALKA